MPVVKIIIDDNAGFCFGVVKAIAAAEEELSHCQRLFCLGDIVHNNAEVRRLHEKGLEVIDYERFEQLGEGNKVLIRAHGEPPSTYTTARQRGIELVDATCPIVLALQQKIRKGYEEMTREGGQVVIFGKPGHAEVIGLSGQTNNTALIVSNPDQLDGIDFQKPIRLYSQTTKSREEYQQLISNIELKVRNSKFGVQNASFVAYDTICNRVSNRAKELEQFAHKVDVLLFVSGKGSSNGHYLYEYCRQVNPNSYFLSDADELQSQWVQGAQAVGITGATSTPRWLMECVMEQVQHLTNN